MPATPRSIPRPSAAAEADVASRPMADDALTDFERATFEHAGTTRDVFRQALDDVLELIRSRLLS